MSDAGKKQIDQVVGSVKDSIVLQPIVVEGYSNDADAAAQITLSNQRAILVEHYLVQRFRLHANDIGVVSLNSRPPQLSGKNVWDGVAILFLPPQRQ